MKNTRTKIDVQKLLAPIKAGHRVGEWLHYDPVYDKMRQARKADDDSLSQGIWQADLKKADWPLLEKLCLEAIYNSSKDLQILAWLAEAWLNLDGIKGLTLGISTISKMLKIFGNQLYPKIDAQDIESIDRRLTLLEWIDRNLSEKVILIPFIKDDANITLANWRYAIDLEVRCKKTNDPKGLLAQSAKDNKLNITQLRVVLSKYLTIDFDNAISNIEDNIKILDQSFTIVKTRCKDSLNKDKILAETKVDKDVFNLEDAWYFSDLTNTLKEMLRILTNEYPKRDQDIKQSLVENTDSIPPEDDKNLISGKNDAYKALEQISNYLKNIDKHSPVPDMLDLLVTWREQDLMDVLASLPKGNTKGHNLLRLFCQTLQTATFKN